ncbi:hypothetical protein K461DRAFT_61521 [Myriangium duriaei CBS 260.36]|uniref:Uncharacterized protein n=1 Tax=Myriangium duriaei CBS 260.36 TaxID=1168546 RepID=A0A9P4IX40_9PEZI|nr:hypothetical protein K461DRAFT_61521 [Myriangium duriaei CBS 260.36]
MSGQATTFKPFALLPTEIRTQIWCLSDQARPHIVPHYDRTTWTFSDDTTVEPLPTPEVFSHHVMHCNTDFVIEERAADAGAANHEGRWATWRQPSWVRNYEEGFDSLYVNPRFWEEFMGLLWLPNLRSESKVERVAIGLATLGSLDLRWELLWRYFPRARTLVITAGDCNMTTCPPLEEVETGFRWKWRAGMANFEMEDNSKKSKAEKMMMSCNSNKAHERRYARAVELNVPLSPATYDGTVNERKMSLAHRVSEICQRLKQGLVDRALTEFEVVLIEPSKVSPRHRYWLDADERYMTTDQVENWRKHKAAVWSRRQCVDCEVCQSIDGRGVSTSYPLHHQMHNYPIYARQYP